MSEFVHVTSCFSHDVKDSVSNSSYVSRQQTATAESEAEVRPQNEARARRHQNEAKAQSRRKAARNQAKSLAKSERSNNMLNFRYHTTHAIQRQFKTSARFHCANLATMHFTLYIETDYQTLSPRIFNRSFHASSWYNA